MKRLRRSLLNLAALAGLLNLAACLGGEAQRAGLPLIGYSLEFQKVAAVELVAAADPMNACHAPHLVTFVLDYKRLRDAIRAERPEAPFIGERQPLPPLDLPKSKPIEARFLLR
jgi:hypothetical protein